MEGARTVSEPITNPTTVTAAKRRARHPDRPSLREARRGARQAVRPQGSRPLHQPHHVRLDHLQLPDLGPLHRQGARHENWLLQPGDLQHRPRPRGV